MGLMLGDTKCILVFLFKNAGCFRLCNFFDGSEELTSMDGVGGTVGKRF